jgi:hypothetical protein
MSHGVQTEKPNTSSSAALWAVLIFVGLIIAAINFVQAESKSEGHGEHGAATEHHDAPAGHDASGGHEAATGHEAENHGEQAAPAATHDSGAAHGEQHETPAAQPAHEEAHH